MELATEKHAWCKRGLRRGALLRSERSMGYPRSDEVEQIVLDAKTTTGYEYEAEEPEDFDPDE